VFLIDEGRSQKIWTTNFVGNKFVSSARLATADQLQPADALLEYFWGGIKGEANRKMIDEDVEKADRLLPRLRLLPGQNRPRMDLRRTRKLDVSDLHHQ